MDPNRLEITLFRCEVCQWISRIYKQDRGVRTRFARFTLQTKSKKKENTSDEKKGFKKTLFGGESYCTNKGMKSNNVRINKNNLTRPARCTVTSEFARVGDTGTTMSAWGVSARIIHFNASLQFHILPPYKQTDRKTDTNKKVLATEKVSCDKHSSRSDAPRRLSRDRVTRPALQIHS
jgi:hypothetical protein